MLGRVGCVGFGYFTRTRVRARARARVRVKMGEPYTPYTPAWSVFLKQCRLFQSYAVETHPRMLSDLLIPAVF
jgi:hypothetical protein